MRLGARWRGSGWGHRGRRRGAKERTAIVGVPRGRRQPCPAARSGLRRAPAPSPAASVPIRGTPPLPRRVARPTILGRFDRSGRPGGSADRPAPARCADPENPEGDSR
jgi:hypothetical protein